MSFHSNLSLWRLAIYAAAVASAAGIVGPIKTESVLAQSIPGVPANVVKAANRFAAPNKVTKLNDTANVDGQVVYELGGVQGSKYYKGSPLEVDVYKSGKLDEIEYTVPKYNQVPAAARNLISRKVSGFVPTLIEKSERPVAAPKFNSKVVYEIEGKNAKGQEVEIDVNPNGTYIVVETPTF
jgi:hypothetical protein